MLSLFPDKRRSFLLLSHLRLDADGPSGFCRAIVLHRREQNFPKPLEILDGGKEKCTRHVRQVHRTFFVIARTWHSLEQYFCLPVLFPFGVMWKGFSHSAQLLFGLVVDCDITRHLNEQYFPLPFNSNDSFIRKGLLQMRQIQLVVVFIRDNASHFFEQYFPCPRFCLVWLTQNGVLHRRQIQLGLWIKSCVKEVSSTLELLTTQKRSRQGFEWRSPVRRIMTPPLGVQ